MDDLRASRKNAERSAKQRKFEARMWQAKVEAFIEDLRETEPARFEQSGVVVAMVQRWVVKLDDPLGVAEGTIKNHARKYLRKTKYKHEAPRV